MLILEDFNFWSNRLEYIKLMKDLKDNVISVQEFHDKFYHMWRLDRDKVSEWDDFEPDSYLRDSFSISGEELRISTISILLEIETRYL